MRLNIGCARWIRTTSLGYEPGMLPLHHLRDIKARVVTPNQSGNIYKIDLAIFVRSGNYPAAHNLISEISTGSIC